MVRELTSIDESILSYKWIANHVAHKISKSISDCHIEDLEAACLVGVALGIVDYNLSSDIRAHLYQKAKFEALMYLRQWRGHGFKKCRGKINVELCRVSDKILTTITSKEAKNRWNDEDWKYVLSPLSDKLARMFELRFRYQQSDKDISDELGYTIKSIRTLISRNLCKLVRTVE